MNFEIKKNELIEYITNVRKDLLLLLESTTDEKLEVKISTHNEAWTLLEVCKHLYTAESGMTQLIHQINNHKGVDIPGVPEDFDLKRYNRRQVEKIQALDRKSVIEKLVSSRKNLLEAINSLDASSLEKKGRHATLKILTIEEIIKLVADHEKGHIQNIKDKLN